MFYIFFLNWSLLENFQYEVFLLKNSYSSYSIHNRFINSRIRRSGSSSHTRRKTRSQHADQRLRESHLQVLRGEGVSGRGGCIKNGFFTYLFPLKQRLLSVRFVHFFANNNLIFRSNILNDLWFFSIVY